MLRRAIMTHTSILVMLLNRSRWLQQQLADADRHLHRSRCVSVCQDGWTRPSPRVSCTSRAQTSAPLSHRQDSPAVEVRPPLQCFRGGRRRREHALRRHGLGHHGRRETFNGSPRARRHRVRRRCAPPAHPSFRATAGSRLRVAACPPRATDASPTHAAGPGANGGAKEQAVGGLRRRGGRRDLAPLLHLLSFRGSSAASAGSGADHVCGLAAAADIFGPGAGATGAAVSAPPEGLRARWRRARATSSRRRTRTLCMSCHCVSRVEL